MQLIVLGMHRSGTSALTQLLTAMGCSFGSQDGLLKADKWNPTGYWERREVIALNDRILHAAGAEWWRVSKLDLKRIGRPRRQQLARRTREVIAALEPHRPWVIKDPRLCLTLPLWQSALDDAFCLLIYRSPLEVARSLHNRNRMPIAFGLALWEFYNLSLLKHTRKLPRLLLSYLDLTRQPVQTARQIHRWLEPRANGSLRLPTGEETHAIVDPSLRRQQISPAFESRYLSSPQIRLATALGDRSAFAWQRTPRLSPISRDLLDDFERAEAERGKLEKELKKERHRYKREVGTRDQALEKNIELHDQMRSAMHELQAKVAADRETLLTRFESEREQIKQKLRHRERELAEAKKSLEEMQTIIDAASRAQEDAELRKKVEPHREEIGRLEVELDDLRERYRVTQQLLTEERDIYADELRLRDSRLETIQQNAHAIERVLIEERKMRAEELRLHTRNAARAEKIQHEMKISFDELMRQKRAEADSFDELMRQRQAEAEDLEAHRQALTRVREEYRSVEGQLRAERQRFEEEQRVRDQAFAHQSRTLADFKQSVISYQARLENIEQDLEAHREALLEAREAHQASAQEYEKTLRHLTEELRIRDEILPEKDRVIAEFARSSAALEAINAQLSRENRLAAPLVLPLRYLLRLMARMRTRRQ